MTGPEFAPADFARTVLPHLDAAYSLARWLLRDPAAAEDVVQDAMLKALTYFASFRGGDARGWLLRIVRNAAYDRLARDPGHVPFDDSHMELPDPSPGPEDMLATGEAEAGLHAALARLPPELRECLVLRELEEMSYRDIARITGVPTGTVMSRLFRARQALIRLVVAPNPKESAS